MGPNFGLGKVDQNLLTDVKLLLWSISRYDTNACLRVTNNDLFKKIGTAVKKTKLTRKHYKLQQNTRQQVAKEPRIRTLANFANHELRRHFNLPRLLFRKYSAILLSRNNISQHVQKLFLI